MKKINVATLIALGMSAPLTALATVPRTFVSTTGNDANPCSLAQPCRTITQAASQTSDGGEIVALDSGGYGNVTANTGRSVSIVAPPGVNASVSQVFLASGEYKPISLRGFDITGPVIQAAGPLIIDRCVITEPANVTALYVNSGAVRTVVKDSLISGAGIGINVDRPYGLTDGYHLTVIDSAFTDVGYGIAVTSDPGVVKVTIVNSRLIGLNSSSGTGLGISSGSSPVRAHVANSVISEFAVAASAASGAAPAGISLAATEIAHNGIAMWANQGTITLVDNNRLIDNDSIALVSGGGGIVTGGTNFKFYNANESLPPFMSMPPF